MKYKITGLFVILLAITLGGLILKPSSVSAAAADDPWYIPSGIVNTARTCNSTNNEAAQLSWMSLKGNSLVTAVEIPYASTGIDLQVNYLVYVCDRGLNRNGDVATVREGTNFLQISSTPNVPGLLQGTRIVTYGGFTSRWSVESKPFRYDFGGPITSRLDLHIDAIDKKINKRRSGGFECVTTPGIPNNRVPANYFDFDACNSTGGSGLDMQINVGDKPTTVTVDTGSGTTASCTNLAGWAVDGDVPSWPLAIDIYVDYPAGDPRVTQTLSTSTNIDRPDVNAGFPGSGTSKHGFDVDIRPYTNGGSQRTFYVYVKNYDSAGTDIGWILTTVPVGPCGTAFNLTPKGGVTLTNTVDPTQADENPTGATFTAGVLSSSTTVNGVTISRRYVTVAPGADPVSAGVNLGPVPASSGSVSVGASGYDFTSDNTRSFTGLSAGTRVCIITTVDPGSGRVDSSGTIINPRGVATVLVPVCTGVSNKPYVSFYGNDVKAGGGFEDTVGCETGSATITTFPASSGSQFAAFALGAISNFKTANMRTTEPIAPDGLSFKNFGTSYGPTCTRNYYKDKPISPNLSLTDPSIPVTYNGKINIVSTPMAIGPATSKINSPRHLYLYIKGDVNIMGNIEMDTGPWANKDDIPSFYLIVQGNINIDNDVTRLDGVYIAQPNPALPGTGIINTCMDVSVNFGGVQVANNALYSSCGKQLTINGAFVSKKVKLQRTYGSASNSADDALGVPRACRTGATAQPSTKLCAAEVFNYNPSIFLAQAPAVNFTTGVTNSDYQYSTMLAPLL